MATLTIVITPAEAAEVATIQVDGQEMTGTRIDLPAPKRVHVSVTAVGFKRYSKDVDVGTITDIQIALSPLPHKRKNRTLAVTLGMGAVSVIAWLVRRR